MTTRGITKTLRRRQLDRTFSRDSIIRNLESPRRGWIHEVRNALGMTGQQLATRLGVRQSTVAKLERGEQEGTVTLRSLRNAAEAMECDLVYALVPRRSLEATLEQQARRQAARIVGRVEHTMALEGQEGSTVTVDEVVADLAEELVRTMSPEIWRAV